MDRTLLATAVLTLALMLGTLAQLALGGRRLRLLAGLPPLDEGEMPPVSVVVAARNEERNLEEALRSVLALRGVAEAIVVEDRSTDRTGRILARMAGEHPRLRVVPVVELPAGWLGKNHALWRGAQAAIGEWILFTDADVVMEPSTLLRALGHARREGLDHLAAAPAVVMPGFLLRLFGVAFSIFFTLFSRPWKARDPRSGAHIGIGAFNLVRAEAYRAVGMHRPIAMRPDDDMKLGKLMKKHGCAQDFVIAAPLVSVEWYVSVRELVHGLEKNGFAGVDYRLSVVVLATVGQLLMFVWPYVALFVLSGPAAWINAAAIVAMLLIFAGAARPQGVPAWYGLAFPVASLMFVYIVWNATITTLWNGGIEWRGTRYSLAELKANRL